MFVHIFRRDAYVQITADFRNKESVQKMGEFLVKVFEKRKRTTDNHYLQREKELKELLEVVIIL